MNCLEDKKRILWVDIARGIGIILVIIGHIVYGYNELLTNFIYSFHMPLFFVISGYLYKNSKNFLRNKVNKLLVPYLFFCVICFFNWFMIERHIRNQEYSPLLSFLDIFIAKGGGYIFNVVMWFLPCLFMTEIIYYYLDNIKKFDNKKLFWVFISLAVLGFIYPKITQIRLPFCIDIVFTSIVFYYMGNVFRENVESKINKNVVIGVICIFINFIVCFLLKKKVDFYALVYDSFFVLYFNSILGIIGVYILSNNIKSKSLEFLGQNSLVIMCIHEPLKRIVLAIVSKLLNINIDLLRSNILGALLVTAIIIILTIPIIIIINRFFPFILGKKIIKNTK